MGRSAAEFHARAAEHARERFGHDAVLEHVRKALALLGSPGQRAIPADALLRWRLLRVREETLDTAGPPRRSRLPTSKQLERLAEILASDARRRLRRLAAQLPGAAHGRLVSVRRAPRERGMAFAESADDHGLRLHALLLASRRHWRCRATSRPAGCLLGRA